MDAVFEELSKKKELREYAELLYRQPDLIPEFLSIIETDGTAVKYQAEKAIRLVSEERPDLLYPYFLRIAALLGSVNHFMQWGALLTLPNLLPADTQGLWAQVRAAYLPAFRSAHISEFGNAVRSFPKILAAHPEEEDVVLPLLLDLDGHVFLRRGRPSPECRDVARGLILDCFLDIYPLSRHPEQLLHFAQESRQSGRLQVQRKAARFLRRCAE